MVGAWGFWASSLFVSVFLCAFSAGHAVFASALLLSLIRLKVWTANAIPALVVFDLRYLCTGFEQSQR